MGTEILRPQDILVERLRINPASSSSRKSTFYYGGPSKPNGKQFFRSDRSKHPISTKRPTSDADLTSFNNHNLSSFGHVTILRRGESLDSKINCHVSKQGGKTSLSDPGNRIKSDLVYAGSAFYTSPSPSSLPLPSFSTKKKENFPVNIDDSATRDLRRLLRLD